MLFKMSFGALWSSPRTFINGTKSTIIFKVYKALHVLTKCNISLKRTNSYIDFEQNYYLFILCSGTLKKIYFYYNYILSPNILQNNYRKERINAYFPSVKGKSCRIQEFELKTRYFTYLLNLTV